MGMNRETGKALTGIEHLKQSIRDILTTRRGERVMLREYGSNLPTLVDNPINLNSTASTFKVDLIYETAVAILEWEPRLRLREINITTAEPGRIELSMTADYLPDGKVITLEGIVVK